MISFSFGATKWENFLKDILLFLRQNGKNMKKVYKIGRTRETRED